MQPDQDLDYKYNLYLSTVLKNILVDSLGPINIQARGD
jgi:hypothetical protein